MRAGFLDLLAQWPLVSTYTPAERRTHRPHRRLPLLQRCLNLAVELLRALARESLAAPA
jgi:hypothetical protein